MGSTKFSLRPEEIFPLVSMRKLEFILGFKRETLKKVASETDSYYHPFDNVKNGKTRHIDNPTGVLKKIQGRIHERILRNFQLPEGMMGGVVGKKAKDNAGIHVGQPIVVTMDLRDCFPRIKDKVIFKVFREYLGCSEEIAKLLTRTTTYKTHLPQGAPTSTILANLALLPMFREMKKIASSKGLLLTQWVDDITLSGPGADKLVDIFIKIIQKHGHAVRHKKVKVMRQSERQEVTGIVVNKKQAASKTRVKTYKDAIFNLARKGSSVTEKELKSILGKIEFVRGVNPSQAKELIKLALANLPLNKKIKRKFLNEIRQPNS